MAPLMLSFALSALLATSATAQYQTGSVATVSADFAWNATTCSSPGSTVCDALCCTQPGGQATPTTLQRDKQNNVCCPYAVSDMCNCVATGKCCPANFLVDAKCCPTPSAQKYTGVLQTQQPGMVCCNTPCREVDTMTDTVTQASCRNTQAYQNKCGIGARSLGPTNYGFNPSYLSSSQLTVGAVNYFQPKALPGSGYTAGASTYSPAGVYSPSVATPTSGAPAQATEVTIDDLINALTQAMTQDNGVFNFNTQSSTNPYSGDVTKSGAMWGTNYQTPYNTPYGSTYGYGGGYGSGYGSGYGYTPAYGYGGSYGSGYGSGYGGYGSGYGTGYGGYGQTPAYGYGGSYGSGYGSGYGGYGQTPAYGYGGGYGSGYGGYGQTPAYGSTGYGGSYGY